jgi:hypothetical protein
LARIAPTNSTKLRWNVGSVNAIEKDINSGSATLGKLIITRLPSGPDAPTNGTEGGLFTRNVAAWPRQFSQKILAEVELSA